MARRLFALITVAVVAAGCSSPATPQAAASPSTPTPTAAQRSEPAELPPLPAEPEQPEPETSEPQERPGPRTCGTVQAASGAQLRVMVENGMTGCAEADRVVRAFHRAIAGQQPARSRRPAKAGVDGWTCVSGPPSARGGTSCSRGTATVSGAVVDAE